MKNVFVFVAVLVLLFGGYSAEAEDGEISLDLLVTLRDHRVANSIGTAGRRLKDVSSMFPHQGLGATFDLIASYKATKGVSIVEVTHVLKGSPAHLAGLRKGDRVTTLGNTDFSVKVPLRVERVVAEALLEDALSQIRMVYDVRVVAWRDGTAMVYDLRKDMIGINVRGCLDSNNEDWTVRLNALNQESRTLAECTRGREVSGEYVSGDCGDSKARKVLWDKLLAISESAERIGDEILSCYYSEMVPE